MEILQTNAQRIKTKILVLTTIFIDVVGIGILIPVLPSYVASFGVSTTVVTLLFGAYAFFSFFSAPYLGSLSDRIGRRKILIISIASSAIGWFIFAKASSVLFLFIGRIIDGLAAGNITTAQSTLADIARDNKERTANLGLFGAMFGLGFILGPTLGGLLASHGNTTPFYFVAILASLNAIFAFFFLPETRITRNADKKVIFNPFIPIIDGFKHKKIQGLFFIWFLFSTALALQQVTFAMYMERIFGFSVSQTGFVFAGIGVLILINQILLRRVLLKKFREKILAIVMFVFFGVGMILQSFPILLAVFAGLVLSTFGQGTLRPVLSSFIAGFNPEKKGEYLGIASSLTTLGMIIGSLIATASYALHPGLPFLVSGIIGLVSFVMMKVFKVISW